MTYESEADRTLTLRTLYNQLMNDENVRFVGIAQIRFYNDVRHKVSVVLAKDGDRVKAEAQIDSHSVGGALKYYRINFTLAEKEGGDIEAEKLVVGGDTIFAGDRLESIESIRLLKQQAHDEDFMFNPCFTTDRVEEDLGHSPSDVVMLQEPITIYQL